MKTVRTLLLNPVCLVACLSFADELPRNAWTPPIDGLSTRLITDRDVYEEGQYVWAFLDVRNSTGQPMDVAYEYQPEKRLRILTADGKALKPRKAPPEENLRTKTAPPGKHTCLTVFYLCGNQYAYFEPLKPGDYRVVWGAEPGQSANGTRFAPSAEATFRVMRMPKDLDREAPAPGPPMTNPASVPWGETKGGLRTRVRADTGTFVDGKPIAIIFEIENVSDRVLYYHVPQIFENGRAKVLDGSGKPVRYTGGSVQTKNPLCSLKPGETARLAEGDLSKSYCVCGPGTYSIEWPGQRAWGATNIEGWGEAEPADSDIPATNRFVFKVASTNARIDPREKALRVLIQHLPPKWEIETSAPVCNLDRPGAQWSRVPAQRYLLQLENPGENVTKEEAHLASICLFITLSRAVEEPWESDESVPPTEYIGFGPYGHLYLAAVPEKALKQWPTIREDLKEWLQIRDPAAIRWSEPVDGFSIGIEVPASPIIFEPVKDWSGPPLIIRKKDASGRETGMRSNAGGRWPETSVLNVYLSNLTEKTIFWSADGEVWTISFFGPPNVMPVHWPGGRPMPCHGPISLGPGEQHCLQVPLRGSLRIWPLVPPGEYTVMVSYDPKWSLDTVIGNGNESIHPYDVPGFWKGVIETPRIAIQVKHP